MFAIGMGMRHVQGTLPDPVYALLSGLNSAITGVIAFAGLQLAQRAVTCPMDIFLIATSAAVACLYEGSPDNVSRLTVALWYYPVIMVISGTVMMFYKRGYVDGGFQRLKERFLKKRLAKAGVITTEAEGIPPMSPRRDVWPVPPPFAKLDKDFRQSFPRSVLDLPISKPEHVENPDVEAGKIELCDVPSEFVVPYPMRIGFSVLAVFVVCFATLMTIREVVKPSPELVQFFANIFLAGTIICGTNPDPFSQRV
jgi:hypothetical protein